MNKNVLKQYLLNKEDLWQYIFTTMFLQEHGLLLSDLNEKPFKAVTCLKFCNTFGEQEELWNLAESVDEYFEDIAQSLDLICQTKSVPWQYDFVEIISKLCKIEIKQDLLFTSIITAYCWGLALPDGALLDIIQKLDERYAALHVSLYEKEKNLKRNLLLTLECFYGRKLNNAADSYAFSELLEAFLPASGHNGMLQALKLSATDEIKLTEEENLCLAFSYCSPYFDDEVNLKRNILPQSSVYARVHEFMHDMRNLQAAQKLQAIEDEEYEKLEDASVYVDPSENCIINVHLDDVLYANVYIKREKANDLSNYPGDFLVLRKNFLYTIEFVEDFSEIPALQEFVKEVKDSRRNLLMLEQKLQTLPLELTPERKKYLDKRAALKEFLASCYCVLEL